MVFAGLKGIPRQGHNLFLPKPQLDSLGSGKFQMVFVFPKDLYLSTFEKTTHAPARYKT